MMLNPALPYIRSLYPINAQPVPKAGTWVGMLNHSLEAPDKPGMARSLASGWFRDPDNETSVSQIIDRGEAIQTYPYGDKVWGCGNGNDYVLVQTEHVGYAGWSKAQWRTRTMLQVIANSAEAQAWYWYREAMPRGIDYYPEWLSLTQIASRSRSGLLTHNDARLVWGGTTHTDPGPNFPYQELRDQIHAVLDRLTGSKHTGHARYYTVVRGDTLSGIGQRTGVPWRNIARYNDIHAPWVIYPGQVLALSGDGKPAAKPKPKPVTHHGPMHGRSVPHVIRRGSGDYYGSYSGPAESHGGYYAGDRDEIRLIQRQLIFSGCVPGVTDPDSGWADGIWDRKTDAPGTGPTSQAMARFQRRHLPLTTRYGECWWDDWTELAKH